MTPEEKEKFDFLEAAARVWLTYKEKKLQPCVLPRHRRPGIGILETTEFLVRYKRGAKYIVAHICENMIIFKHNRGVQNITRVYFNRLVPYLSERVNHSPPGILLDR